MNWTKFDREIGSELCRLVAESYVFEIPSNVIQAAVSKGQFYLDDPAIFISEIPTLKAGESGISICKNGRFAAIPHGCDPDHPTECRTIDYDACKRLGMRYIGNLHTHPDGSLLPSSDDIVLSIQNSEDLFVLARHGTK